MSDFRLSFQQFTNKKRGNLKFNIVETDEIKTTVNVLIPFKDYIKQYTTIYELNT